MFIGTSVAWAIASLSCSSALLVGATTAVRGRASQFCWRHGHRFYLLLGQFRRFHVPHLRWLVLPPRYGAVLWRSIGIMSHATFYYFVYRSFSPLFGGLVTAVLRRVALSVYEPCHFFPTGACSLHVLPFLAAPIQQQLTNESANTALNVHHFSIPFQPFQDEL